MNTITYCLYMSCFLCVQLAKQHGTELFETSAWTNQNISEAFAALAEKILDSVSFIWAERVTCDIHCLSMWASWCCLIHARHVIDVTASE